MAKKKDEEVVVDSVEGSNSDMMKSLNKLFPGIAFDGPQLLARTGKKISTGLIAFDTALNDGILEGTIMNIGGMPKCGKSSLCLRIAAQFQKEGKHVYYIDAEGRLQIALLNCIPDLKQTSPDFNIIRSSQETVLTAEQILTVIETIIKDDPGSLIVLDSLAALSAEAEIVGTMSDQQRANLPKLMYKFLRKTIPLIFPTKTNLITITHSQANVSGYGAPTKDVGGNGIIFFSSYLLTCVSSTEVKDKDNKSLGKDSKFKIKAVADGAPDAEPIAYIRYGKGADQIVDLYSSMVELGMIAVAGSWYTIEVDSFKNEKGEYPKFQGQDRVCTFLADPKNFEAAKQQVQTMLKS